jgi:hypothetical protein
VTDTLIDYDPNDTGDIPPIDDLGIEATRDLSSHARRRDTTGEATQNLGPYSEFARRIRRPASDETAKMKLVDVPLGLSTGDLAPYWDIEPDSTVTFGVVYQAAATIDGELRPAAPGPFPVPLPPDPKPDPKPGYAGRHRLGLRGRAARGLRAPLWARVAIGAGLIVLAGAYAGLVLAALAVFW